MPEGSTRKNWTSCAILVALAIRGVPSFLLALVILPAAAAVQAAVGGWVSAAAVCAAAAAGCVYRMPGAMCACGILWCAACGTIASVKLKKRIWRPLMWATLTLAAWCAMLALLSAEVVLLEGVRLSAVPDGAYLLNCAPLNLGETDGAPCRAILTDL